MTAKTITRRQAAGWLAAAGVASRFPHRALASTGAPFRLGLNTWSLRALKHEQAIPAIILAMQRMGMRDCQLLFSHAEPESFDPDFASFSSASPKTLAAQKERRRKAEARKAWLQSAPLSYFDDLRLQFASKDLVIRVYNSPFGESEAEIDRVFLMARALGASAINTRVSEKQIGMVATAAAHHKLIIGLQVADPQVTVRQLDSSAWFRLDPDIGDLTKANLPALAFLQEHLEQIASVDLKDALPAGPSVPFGTGAANVRDVVKLLAGRPDPAIAYIDCDYPGTGASTEEVERCVRYVRGVLEETGSSR